MDPNEYRNDPTLGEAMEALAAMETAENAGTQQQQAQPQSQQSASATNGQRATESSAPSGAAKVPDGAEAQAAESKPKSDPKAGTPATEEKPKTEQEQQQQQPDNRSKFAKSQERLNGSWKDLNERKAELAKTEETLKQREAELKKREAAYQQRQTAAQQPKYKPEDYEGAAANWERLSGVMMKRAEQLEAEGSFDEAEKLKKDAAVKANQATQAKAYAAELRANPPAPVQTDAQAEAEFRSQQKEWWGKAAVDFPNVAKAGTPEADALKALIKNEPEVVGNPKGMYYAARLVTAEASAARVPAMEKELGELRAKLDALSKKLAVPGDGAATSPGGEIPFAQKSEAEQEAELYRMAGDIDAQRGGI